MIDIANNKSHVQINPEFQTARCKLVPTGADRPGADSCINCLLMQTQADNLAPNRPLATGVLVGSRLAPVLEASNG